METKTVRKILLEDMLGIWHRKDHGEVKTAKLNPIAYKEQDGKRSKITLFTDEYGFKSFLENGHSYDEVYTRFVTLNDKRFTIPMSRSRLSKSFLKTFVSPALLAAYAEFAEGLYSSHGREYSHKPRLEVDFSELAIETPGNLHYEICELKTGDSGIGYDHDVILQMYAK